MRLSPLHVVTAQLLGTLLGLAAAEAGVPTVVTDIPPVHSLVAQVMGDLGQPVLLLDQGADLHDFQLRPSQARALADAAVIIWIGPEISPWLERALNIAPDAVSVALLNAQGTFRRSYEAKAGPHSHDGSVDPAAGAPPLQTLPGDPRDVPQTDPHAWLDPANAVIWLGVIADQLSVLDPGNSIAYRANASLAQASLATLEADLNQTLEVARGKPIIVAHDALGYFSDHFGLTVAGSLAEGDAADPGAAHLSEIRAMLASGDIACIFPEVLTDPARVAALADATPARIGAALDPEGRDLIPSPMLYEALLTRLAKTIAECLSDR